MLDYVKRFLHSKHFPLVVACILFVSSSLDVGITNYVHRVDPDLFHDREAGELAKRFFVTELWWISYLSGALNNILIVLVSAWASERNKLLGYVYIYVRIACLFFALFPLLAVLCWMHTLNSFVV